MNEKLFDIPESLSPKLAWLRANGLVTSYAQEHEEGGDSPETGADLYPWTCCRLTPDRKDWITHGLVGVGRTEEEAILAYCAMSDLPHYSLKP